MARKSARLIGKLIGKNAHEINTLLEEIGFIKKDSDYVSKTGAKLWRITDLGKKHGDYSAHPYSNGFVWDDEVAEILKKVFKL